jgi:predicted component of type VI protein secretion system
MIDATTLREGWIPCARDADAAERLEAEIARLGSLAAEEPAWPAIREHALAVLRGSPDLAAAVYLTQASLALEGLGGLADGLTLVHELVSDRWETLEPPRERPRARRALLAWLAERAARQLTAAPEPALLERCVSLAAGIGGICESRFGEPVLGPLRRKLEGLRATPSTMMVSAPAVPQPAPAAPSIAIASRGEAVARLAAAADYFQRCEPHSPVGPLLRRAIAWCDAGFEEVFRELLARAPEARTAMWETLGLKPEPKR